MEDIKFGTSYKRYEGEGEYNRELIRVSCSVDKYSYKNRIVLWVSMEYSALCKNKAHMYDSDYVDFTYRPEEGSLKIWEDRWYGPDYRWDGRSYFDLIPNDRYLSKESRRACK